MKKNYGSHKGEVIIEVAICPQYRSIGILELLQSKAEKFVRSSTKYNKIVWYAKDAQRVKYRQLYFEKEILGEGASQYTWVRDKSGKRFNAGGNVKKAVVAGGEAFSHDNITSQRPAQGNDTTEFSYLGQVFSPGKGTFKTDDRGLQRLSKAGRLLAVGDTLRYTRYIGDFNVSPITQLWDDTVTSGFSDKKVYVVQTHPTAIERCLLMTTDPGDLVLDPTCGSGTTAFVAEKWGRRWMTVDTSRVAIALARQRLMTASYDYYTLKYPHEGLKGGFLYKTVPHVTLKSIANNPEIDSIYERMHPAIEKALAALNAAFRQHPPAKPFVVAEGARKGQALSPAKMAADGLQEWEVPFEAPLAWPDALRPLLDAFHTARLAMQRQMDDAIARGAQQEQLVDRPEVDKARLRVSGPFTVEAVPFPSVQSLDAPAGPAHADASAARSGGVAQRAFEGGHTRQGRADAAAGGSGRAAHPVPPPARARAAAGRRAGGGELRPGIRPTGAAAGGGGAAGGRHALSAPAVSAVLRLFL